MKTRTRVVAWVYICVCSVGALAGLIQTVGLILQRDLAVVTLPLALLLVNAALLLCWVAFLKGRSWAWMTLIVLLGLSSLSLVALSMASGTVTGAWWVVLIPAANGWISIPALVLLLLDRPSIWHTPNALRGPDADQREIKQRTRIVAWVFLVFSAWAFLGLPIMFVIRHRMHGHSVLLDLPGALVWVLWLGLLSKRIWAWWSLMAVNSAFLAWGIWNTMHLPAYYAAHHKPLTHPGGMMAFNSVWIGLAYLLPLIFLLTDKPSGWTRHEEAQA